MPTLYEALDVVSRELVGMIPAVTISPTASGVSKGQIISVPITNETSTEDANPSGTTPSGDGETFSTVNMTISKVKRSKPILWTGEDENAVQGVVNPIKRNQFINAFRALVNEMEIDIAKEAVAGALEKGNVVGTAGKTPFAEDTKDLTLVRKTLSDKGAPLINLQFVMSTDAGMNLRNIEKLHKVNEAGDNTLLRQGVLGNLFGFNLRESAGFAPHTKGTGEGYLVNGGASKGAIQVAIDTGSGTFVKGDIVTFGDDTHKYVVAEDVATGGTILKITAPLVTDIPDNAAVVISSDYMASVGFTSGSIVLANRLPFVPADGDSALDRTIMTDPLTGIPFEVAVWGGAYQNTITIATAWGVKNIKGEHTVALLG